MDLNWGLLGNAPDAGMAFQNGLLQGQQRRKQQQIDEALRGLGGNPNDPRAVNALIQADPHLGMQYQQQQREQHQVELKAQQDEQKRQLDLIGGLAKGAKTPEQWDAAVDQLVGMGMTEAAQYRGKFSPETRLAIMGAAGVKDDDPTPMEQEYQFILRTRGEAAARSFIDSKANPIQWVRTEDATGIHLTPVPRSGGMDGGEPDIPVAATPEEAKRLPPGSLFKTPDGRTLRVPGGASPSGSPTFPQ